MVAQVKRHRAAKRTIEEPMFGYEQELLNKDQINTLINRTIQWYGEHYDTVKSKQWALEWIKGCDALKKYENQFKKMPHTWFGNKGFICRASDNGLKINSDSLIKTFSWYLNVDLPKETTPLPQAARKIVIEENTFLDALDECEDVLMFGDKLDIERKSKLQAISLQLKQNEKRSNAKEVKRRRELLVKDVELGHYGKGQNKGIKATLKLYDTLIHEWLIAEKTKKSQSPNMKKQVTKRRKTK